MDGTSVLTEADANITITDAAGGLVHISVPGDTTASLEAGRYIDALQVTIGDVVSPLWIGEILVAANPRRAMLPP